MTNVIIFDIDKTLFYDNLPEIILSKWSLKNSGRLVAKKIISNLIMRIPINWIKRRVEYFLILFIRKIEVDEITSDLLSDLTYANIRLFDRMHRYKKCGFHVILVTAAPAKIALTLGEMKQVEVFYSRSFCGIITNDLLAKKHKIYKLLEKNNRVIRTIYSDSKLDFWPSAKNFLVSGNKLEISNL